MAWSAPMTAVANAAFPAADFNTYLRDNLNVLGPNTSNVANGFPARRFMRGQSAGVPFMRDVGQTDSTIATQETTTSTSYTNLTTVGPSCTAFSVSGWVFVIAYCNTVTTVTATGGVDGAGMSYELIGAVTNIPANDIWATMTSQPVASANENIQNRAMSARLHAVTANETITVTCKYRNTTGQGWFSDRYLLVVSL